VYGPTLRAVAASWGRAPSGVRAQEPTANELKHRAYRNQPGRWAQRIEPGMLTRFSCQTGGPSVRSNPDEKRNLDKSAAGPVCSVS
jgi:hypothetical protein